MVHSPGQDRPGNIDLTTDSDARAVQRLTGQREIAELCVRYTAALDTKGWALPESCFAPSPVFVCPEVRGYPAAR
jgi:hypothetical protein